MFQWLVKLVIKPLISPLKKVLGLCDSLESELIKLVTLVGTLPLEQSFKDRILKTVSDVVNAVKVIRTVISKVLDAAGVDSAVTSNSDSIAKKIESIK